MSISWDELLITILSVVDGVSDLKPKRGQKRTVESMIDWIHGKSIPEIAKVHFDDKIEKRLELLIASQSSYHGD